MSILHLDVGKESEPYDLFIFAINAEQTKQKYITRMKKFLEIIGIDQENKLTLQERYNLFVERRGVRRILNLWLRQQNMYYPLLW